MDNIKNNLEMINDGVLPIITFIDTYIFLFVIGSILIFILIIILAFRDYKKREVKIENYNFRY